MIFWIQFCMIVLGLVDLNGGDLSGRIKFKSGCIRFIIYIIVIFVSVPLILRLFNRKK